MTGLASDPPFAPRGLPRRDRIAILTALVGTVAIAWIQLVRMAAGMQGMGAMEGASLGVRPWAAADFLLMFWMWAVMMVGMMVPTAMPVTLVYAAVARKAARQGTPVASTALFVLGYGAAWTLFSVAATVAQWALDRAALLSPTLVSTSPRLGAALLVAAGAYQWTSAKDACLDHCRMPAHFIARFWRSGRAGAFRLGAIHGAYCLGCCWALMGLLFFGGVMNLLWILAITLFILLEKLLPGGRALSRWSGLAMVATGLALAAAPWLRGG